MADYNILHLDHNKMVVVDAVADSGDGEEVGVLHKMVDFDDMVVDFAVAGILDGEGNNNSDSAHLVEVVPDSVVVDSYYCNNCCCYMMDVDVVVDFGQTHLSVQIVDYSEVVVVD